MFEGMHDGMGSECPHRFDDQKLFVGFGNGITDRTSANQRPFAGFATGSAHIQITQFVRKQVTALGNGLGGTTEQFTRTF